MVDLRKLREASTQLSGASVSPLGIVGSLVAAVGAFCPLVDSLGHHVTYFARGHGDGQIVVGAAFIGLAGAIVRARLVTATMGIVILAMLYNLRNHEIIAIARMQESIAVDWGLYVMAAGAVLMLVSPLIPRRRTR